MDPIRTELTLLRQAYQEQGKLLGTLVQRLSQLESNVSTISTDIHEIKECLNGSLRPKGT